MPFGSGRKQSYEWTEVLLDENTGKVTCKHCNNVISAKIERVRLHLASCKQRISSQEVSPLNEFVDPHNLNISASGSSMLPTSTTTQGIKRKQSSMGEFVMKTTEEQKQKLDYSIAKFFYSNNLAFNAASSKEYKEMINALRPGYEGPDRKQIAGTLLNKAVDEVQDGIQVQLKNNLSTITLLQDGWSSVQNDPIIATCIHTGQESILLDAVDCEKNKKTSEFCLNLMKKAIEMCAECYGKEVFAVCTDNEPKMVKMRELLSNEFKNIITYGCSAHYLNLLEEEITPKEVVKHIVEVQKYFRNHHQPHGLLKEKNGRMPQIPNATRWNSHVACLSTFNENYTKYVEIETENDLPVNISKILNNVAIYRESVYLNRQLSHLGKVLDTIQADNTNIAQAVELWLDLLENPDFVSHKGAIQSRMTQSLLPCHFLANLLDPRYQGSRLSQEDEEAAENWLMGYNAAWLPCLMSFRIKDTDMYPSSMFADSVIQTLSPAKWWLLMETKCNKNVDFPKGFCCFARNLVNCPASSAGIERVFSSYGLVWSDLRNRLGKDTALKLVKVYRHLRCRK